MAHQRPRRQRAEGKGLHVPPPSAVLELRRRRGQTWFRTKEGWVPLLSEPGFDLERAPSAAAVGATGGGRRPAGNAPGQNRTHYQLDLFAGETGSGAEAG
jgi:hypothetical protein